MNVIGNFIFLLILLFIINYDILYVVVIHMVNIMQLKILAVFFNVQEYTHVVATTLIRSTIYLMV